MRYDVIALDEVGYVLLAEIGADFLFQVIAERETSASPSYCEVARRKALLTPLLDEHSILAELRPPVP